MTTPFSVTHGLMKGVAAATVAAGSAVLPGVTWRNLPWSLQCSANYAQNLAKHKAVNKGKIFGKCFVFWRRQFHDKPNQFAGISCLNHVHIMFDVAKANKTARLLQHFVSAMCVKERVKYFSDLIFLWAIAWIIFVISNIKELGKHK